ncbi:MAG: TPMT family class I SAM-dependent methyltransferase [Flavobacteriales bacterium]|nr:TPMT family class I SAM-dependent methyltransferase [Flavobacteriales bacterium]
MAGSMELDAAFWTGRYAVGNTGWDIGGASAPLKAYFDQITDKGLEILIPGGGRSHEAEYLHRSGFRHIHVVDLSGAPFADLVERCPDFPRGHLHVGNFFDHAGRYDRIIEQTFFCALAPALRPHYVEHMHKLLAPGGKLAGVLFDDPLFTDHPPFGGNKEEYLALFKPLFPGVSLERCYNSIAPRAGRELWLMAPR